MRRGGSTSALHTSTTRMGDLGCVDDSDKGTGLEDEIEPEAERETGTTERKCPWWVQKCMSLL